MSGLDLRVEGVTLAGVPQRGEFSMHLNVRSPKVKQLNLFGAGGLPRQRGPNIRALTERQSCVIACIMLGSAPTRRDTTVLRRLIRDKLVEVVSLGPASYRVTEYGRALRASGRVRR